MDNYHFTRHRATERKLIMTEHFESPGTPPVGAEFDIENWHGKKGRFKLVQFPEAVTIAEVEQVAAAKGHSIAQSEWLHGFARKYSEADGGGQIAAATDDGPDDLLYWYLAEAKDGKWKVTYEHGWYILDKEFNPEIRWLVRVR